MSDETINDHNIREAIYSEIGKRVKLAREQVGMTQMELSKNLGLTRVSVANIEAGRQRFAVDTLYKLAACLGIEVYELLPVPPVDLDRIR